ncbi:4-hydroxy-tetrahydrodipicolinate synthase [Hyphobacterium sp. CCMP332]|nr:4-hydroxy-tetrahydrodipicolinate synthase [Hyphobacterium sp. CCMP332]
MVLKGTGVALVTPFDKNLSIDYSALQGLLDFVSKGVEYLVVQGTTGESPTLSLKEKQEILKFVKDNNDDKLPIVYGIGGNNTNEVISQINSTDLSGVEAILSVSPYYNKPSQSALIRHYTMIADVSPVPVILYNVPGRTGGNLNAGTTLELSKHNNIIGIKEASGNMDQITEIALNKEDSFLLISGDDMLTVPMISLGAAGVISVISNAFPMEFGDLVRKALEGDFKSERPNYRILNRINPLLYKESNPVGIKQVLKSMGICEGYCRPPLFEASENLQKEIKMVLKK